MNKGEIITICGSSRFNKDIQLLIKQLALNGFLTFSYPVLNEGELDKITKEIFSDLWKNQIDLSDSIFVFNYDYYIGESTKDKISYAISKNKNIYFLNNPAHKRDDLLKRYAIYYKLYPIEHYGIMCSNRLYTHRCNEQEFEILNSKINPKIRKDVMSFIYKFSNKIKPNAKELRTPIEILFSDHSYYFASILRTEFGGKILWSSTHESAIWADENNICYDIYGIVNDSIPEGFIPIDLLNKDELEKIKHI